MREEARSAEFRTVLINSAPTLTGEQVQQLRALLNSALAAGRPEPKCRPRPIRPRPVRPVRAQESQ